MSNPRSFEVPYSLNSLKCQNELFKSDQEPETDQSKKRTSKQFGNFSFETTKIEEMEAVLNQVLEKNLKLSQENAELEKQLKKHSGSIEQREENSVSDYMTTINNLKMEISRLNNKLKSSKTELIRSENIPEMNSRNEASDLQRRIRELEEYLKDKENEIGVVTKQCNEVTEAYTRLRRNYVEVRPLLKELHELKGNMKIKEDNLEELKLNYDKLRTEYQEMSKNNCEANDLQKRIRELEEYSKDRENEIGVVTKQCNELKNENRNIREVSSNDVTLLQDTLRQMKKDNDMKVDYIKEVKVKYEKLLHEYENVQRNKCDVRVLQERIRELEDNLKDKENQVEDMIKQCNQLDQENRELQEDSSNVRVLQERIRELEYNLKDKENKVEGMIKQCNHLDQENRKLQEDSSNVRNLERELRELKGNAESKEDLIEKLTFKYNNLRTEHEKIQEKNDDVNKLQEKLVAKDDRIKALKKENHDAMILNETFRMKANQLDKELTKVKSEEAIRKLGSDKNEKAAAELDDLRRKLAGLTAENRDLDRRIKSQQLQSPASTISRPNDVQSCPIGSKAVNDEVNVLRSENEKLKQNLESRHEDIAKKQIALEKMKEKLKWYIGNSNTNNIDKSEIERHSKEINDANDTIETLKADNRKLREEMAKTKRANLSLEEEMSNMKKLNFQASISTTTSPSNRPTSTLSIPNYKESCYPDWWNKHRIGYQ